MGFTDLFGNQSERRIEKIIKLIHDAKEKLKHNKPKKALNYINDAHNRYHKYNIDDLELYKKIMRLHHSWLRDYRTQPPDA